jgi:hypothetical protein
MLQCDIPTAVRGYRSFLQLVDLTLTKQTPYVLLSPDFSGDDLNRLTGQFSAREALALSWFPPDAPFLLRLKTRAVSNISDALSEEGSSGRS